MLCELEDSRVVSRSIEPAVQRNKHSAVVWEHTVVIYGGHDLHAGRFLGDVLCYGTESGEWSSPQCQGDIPTPRRAHSAALIGHRMIIFGGFSGDDCLSDLHSCDLRTWTWTKLRALNKGPCPRGGHSAVVDPATSSVLVFGGWDIKHEYHGDIWRLTCDPAAGTASWEELRPQSRYRPNGRVGHRAAWDDDRRTMLVFGGFGKKYWNNICEFDPATKRWAHVKVKGALPKGRTYHAMECCGGRLLVIGGSDYSGEIADAWCINLRSKDTPQWQQLMQRRRHCEATGRFAHSSCRDGHRVYIYGGICMRRQSVSVPGALILLEAEAWAADCSLQRTILRYAAAHAADIFPGLRTDTLPDRVLQDLLEYCRRSLTDPSDLLSPPEPVRTGETAAERHRRELQLRVLLERLQPPRVPHGSPPVRWAPARDDQVSDIEDEDHPSGPLSTYLRPRPRPCSAPSPAPPPVIFLARPSAAGAGGAAGAAEAGGTAAPAGPSGDAAAGGPAARPHCCPCCGRGAPLPPAPRPPAAPAAFLPRPAAPAAAAERPPSPGGAALPRPPGAHAAPCIPAPGGGLMAAPGPGPAGAPIESPRRGSPVSEPGEAPAVGAAAPAGRSSGPPSDSSSGDGGSSSPAPPALTTAALLEHSALLQRMDLFLASYRRHRRRPVADASG